MNLEDPVIRRMPLSELNPAEYNPRKITNTAFEGLGKSIKTFGMMVPIIWNERTGNIVGGHQRYRHLVESGETETDVVVVDLDDNEEVALNITLNNRFIRGKFTKEVMALLDRVDGEMGAVFDEVGLSDLQNYVKRLKFDIPDEDKGKDKGKDKESSDPGDSSSDVPDVSGDPNAVIRCPRCRSMWRMDNNKVVYNAISK